jgi:hypothetical protein
MKRPIQNGGHNIQWFLALLLACVTGTPHADELAGPRYPWDNRPTKCFTEPSASQPECIFDNWPSFEETIRRLAFLYGTEQFALLERAMTDLTKSEKTFASGKSTASAAYQAFRRLMPAPGTRPNEQDRIRRWKEAIPNSYFVVFADARYLYGDAWNSRGSGYAGSVSPESWDLYALRLQEAEKKLMSAPQSLKDTPLWDNLLLAIALDSRKVESVPQVVFENAVKRWPRYFDFYEVMLTRLTPKWGGSWDDVEMFIDKWSRQRESTEGTSMYARLYIGMLSQGATPDETAMKWAKMRTSFDDLVARYPEPRFKNLYASFACFARDKSSFGKAMSLLPSRELMPDEWLPGSSYEACIRWAGV